MSQQTRGITNPIASQLNSNMYVPPDSAGYASNIPSSQAGRIGSKAAKSIRPDIGGYQSQLGARYNQGIGISMRPNVLANPQRNDLFANHSPGKQFTTTGNKNHFMHLRNKNNRTGMYSVDRNRAGKGGRMFPETAVGGVRAGINYAAANNQKFQYNSSSIPYLNKNSVGSGA